MELLEIQEEHYRKQPMLNPSHKKLIIIEHFFTSVRVCVRHFKLIIWKIPKLFLSKCVETTDWRMYHLRLAVPADMLTSALHLLLLYGEISFHPHTVTDSLIHTKKWDFFSWGKRKGDEQCLQNKYKPQITPNQIADREFRAQLAMNEIKEVRTKTYSANQAPCFGVLFKLLFLVIAIPEKSQTAGGRGTKVLKWSHQCSHLVWRDSWHWVCLYIVFTAV